MIMINHKCNHRCGVKGVATGIKLGSRGAFIPTLDYQAKFYSDTASHAIQREKHLVRSKSAVEVLNCPPLSSVNIYLLPNWWLTKQGPSVQKNLGTFDSKIGELGKLRTYSLRQ
jgi:hypothetical protein